MFEQNVVFWKVLRPYHATDPFQYLLKHLRIKDFLIFSGGMKWLKMQSTKQINKIFSFV